MTRANLIYNEVREHRTFEGFDPDTPIAGFYRMKLVTGGHPVGVRLFYGPPHDPVTGEEMDRGHRWQAEVNGRPYLLEYCWPKCAADPIGAAEAAHLQRLQEWGEANAPNSPQANPNRRIDLLTAPINL